MLACGSMRRTTGRTNNGGGRRIERAAAARSAAARRVPQDARGQSAHAGPCGRPKKPPPSDTEAGMAPDARGLAGRIRPSGSSAGPDAAGCARMCAVLKSCGVVTASPAKPRRRGWPGTNAPIRRHAACGPARQRRPHEGTNPGNTSGRRPAPRRGSRAAQGACFRERG